MEKLLRPDRFDGTQDTTPAEWEHWLRTFTNFLDCLSGDSAPDKLKLLINHVSPAVYNYISACTTFTDAIEVLKAVYVKPTNEVFARHRLATRKQASGESVDQFLQSLKLLSKDCCFKDVTKDTYTQEAIRDAFISGLSSPSIRQRLLEKDTLTLNEAIQLARSLDSAQRNAEMYVTPVSGGNFSSALEKTPTAPWGSPRASLEKNVIMSTAEDSSAATFKATCYYCGNLNHPRVRCPARNVVCLKCGRRGHFGKVCKAPITNKRRNTGAFTSAATHDDSVACPTDVADPPHRTTINVRVNDVKMTALVDSGSTISFLHPSITKQLGIHLTPASENIILASSDFSTQVMGNCFVDLKVQHHSYPLFKFSVIPQLCAKVILGQDFMEMHKSVEFDLKGPKPKLTICGVTTMSIDPPSLFPNLTDDCKPVSTPTRRFCKADELFIKEEVKSLLSQGIIEKSQSPWRAQVLVTKDERHKRRMVVDYSRTINRFTQLDAYPFPRIHEMVHNLAKFKVFSKLDLKSAYYQIPLREDEKLYTAFEADGQLYQYNRIPFGLTNSVAVFQRAINSIISDNHLESTFAYIDDLIICGHSFEDHDRNLRNFRKIASKYNLTLNEAKCQYGLTKISYLGYLISDGSLSPDPERLKPLKNLPVPSDSASMKRCLGLLSYYSQWIPNYSTRIQPLLQANTFPLNYSAAQSFEALKAEICRASVAAFDEDLPLQVETDASATSLAATLSQIGRPVAFFSRTLTPSEKRQPAIEREATAIIEAVRKWRLFLLGRHFTIITDQQAVSFMFHMKNSSKIKNDKIMRWRLELSEYHFDIHYRPGLANVPSDTLSRACFTSASTCASLEDIHASLCHPGVTRLNHFVRTKNLPYSLEDVKRVCSQCSVCSEVKPRFFKPPKAKLIHAMHPFDRLSVDFIGPKASSTRNKYLLIVIDEHSRFPFAFPCPDMSAQTVISCFMKLFSLFGCPTSIHSDRGPQFMSRDVSDFLMQQGVVMTHSTPYHPQGNGQCERENGIIWKSVLLALRTRKLPDTHWELVLDHVLHSIRSLLCTATNQTPHERLFSFPRKSSNGYSLPTWLSSPGPVLLRKFVRSSKSDPLVEPVDLVTATPHYAKVRFPDGRESTVSTKDLAPSPKSSATPQVSPPPSTPPENLQDSLTTSHGNQHGNHHSLLPSEGDSRPLCPDVNDQPVDETSEPPEKDMPRRSTRIRKPIDRLTYS